MFRPLLKMLVLGYLVLFTLSVKALLLYMYLQNPAEFMYRVEKGVYPVMDKLAYQLFGVTPSSKAAAVDVVASGKLANPASQANPENSAERAKLLADKAPAEQKQEQQQAQQQEQQLQQELLDQFGRWQPQAATTSLTGVELDGVSYATLAEAIKQLKDNSHLKIPAGVYQEPLFIRHHNVTIEGVGHVVFEKAATQGKGYILAAGNDLTVRNIECRFIKVDSKNGACVRLEGRGLVLDHVYFHSSETALLETAKEHGYIRISNSRFENLAGKARAHSIYLNKASLHLENSVILGNRHQHSLKSRGPKTVIDTSILSELSASASRLIDISNGGELSISRSLLHKGPNSVNNQVIGFGLEGVQHSSNQISIRDSLLLLDRPTGNYIVHAGDNKVDTHIENNVIVASSEQWDGNIHLKTRAELQLAAYPALPAILCHLQRCAGKTP